MEVDKIVDDYITFKRHVEEDTDKYTNVLRLGLLVGYELALDRVGILQQIKKDARVKITDLRKNSES